MNKHNDLSPMLKAFKDKIDRVSKAEKEYWESTIHLGSQLESKAPDYYELIKDSIPEKISTMLYACLDGVIIIKYMISEMKVDYHVNYIDKPMRFIFQDLPVPSPIGMINLGSAIRMSPTASTTFNNCTFGQVKIPWLHITSFYYEDTNKKISKMQNALNEFKLFLLSINLGNEPKSIEQAVAMKGNVLDQLKRKISEFESLLDTASEEDIQVYLKQNSIIIDQFSKVIPKQKLGEDFVTDFVLLNLLDQGPKYTLIEIESPTKEILTKEKVFTAKFNQAVRQIHDWKIWLEDNKAYIQNKLDVFV